MTITSVHVEEHANIHIHTHTFIHSYTPTVSHNLTNSYTHTFMHSCTHTFTGLDIDADSHTFAYATYRYFQELLLDSTQKC